MSLLTSLFRIVVLGLVIWLVGRLFRVLARTASPAAGPKDASSSAGRPSGAPERLVRDPHCGVALPQSRAIAWHGEFFCSESCRSAHEAGTPAVRRGARPSA